MKRINKALAGLMALVLMVAFCVTGWADDSDIVEIKTLVLGALDNSASDWYKTEDMRTLLVAGFVFDVFASSNQTLSDLLIESLVYGTTYVAKDESYLKIYSFGDKGTVLGVYDPAYGILFASQNKVIDKSLRKSTMDALKNDGSFTSYYKVNNTDVKDTLEMLVEVLNN